MSEKTPCISGGWERRPNVWFHEFSLTALLYAEEPHITHPTASRFIPADAPVRAGHFRAQPLHPGHRTPLTVHRLLTHKAALAGKRVIKVDEHGPGLLYLWNGS
ncbi:hypothetical protein [Methanoculleus sp. 10]|uniref:hypothetical protein n=1 Tax=Methanoculleus sp. 10 TaxID=430615 RepID=UPI0025D4FEAE|nr:hypothetical protein [Methanoculleus sp. 10]